MAAHTLTAGRTGARKLGRLLKIHHNLVEDASEGSLQATIRGMHSFLSVHNIDVDWAGLRQEWA